MSHVRRGVQPRTFGLALQLANAGAVAGGLDWVALKASQPGRDWSYLLVAAIGLVNMILGGIIATRRRVSLLWILLVAAVGPIAFAIIVWMTYEWRDGINFVTSASYYVLPSLFVAGLALLADEPPDFVPLDVAGALGVVGLATIGGLAAKTVDLIAVTRASHDVLRPATLATTLLPLLGMALVPLLASIALYRESPAGPRLVRTYLILTALTLVVTGAISVHSLRGYDFTAVKLFALPLAKLVGGCIIPVLLVLALRRARDVRTSDPARARMLVVTVAAARLPDLLSIYFGSFIHRGYLPESLARSSYEWFALVAIPVAIATALAALVLVRLASRFSRIASLTATALFLILFGTAVFQSIDGFASWRADTGASLLAFLSAAFFILSRSGPRIAGPETSGGFSQAQFLVVPPTDSPAEPE